MFKNYLGWLLIIFPILLVLFLLADWYKIKTKNARDCDQSPPAQKKLNNNLFQAIDAGNVKKVEAAISAGADVNVHGHGGKTPLIMTAIRAMDVKNRHDRSNFEITKILIKNGADVNANDLFNSSAIQYCDIGLSDFVAAQIAGILQKNGASGFPRNSSTESSL